jgi:hypothetical protein
MGTAMRRSAFASTALLAALVAGPVAAQATRTWVSGVGNDANPCSRTAPCKTFAGAISKTAPAGEISVLDPGGFGALTIGKSISINGEWGGEAGVLASLTTGIIVNAGANDIVNIRGVMIEGAGNGTNGIRYLAGGALHVQNTVIRGFRGSSVGNNNGILVNPTGGSLVIDLDNVVLADNGTLANGGAGLSIKPTGSATVRATATRVQALNNQIGINVDGDLGTGAIDLTVSDSTVARNAGDGISSKSPNGTDALVRVTVDSSAVSNNGAIGIHSVGQRSTVRVKDTISTANFAAGLQGNNSGILASYGDNGSGGNGAANAGVTAEPPS